MHAARLVEDAERQPRDLLRMLRPVSAPLAELDDAPATDVGVTLDFANPGAVAMDVVDHQAFAECEIAQRQVLGAKPAKDGVEKHRAGNVQVRTPWIQPRHVETLLDVRADEAFPQSAQRFAAHPLVPNVFRRGALFVSNRERPETQDGSRRADDAIKSSLRELLEVRAHLFVEMFHQPPFVVGRQGIGLDEPFGQPDDARLEALSESQVRGGAERDFDAAAPNIDDDRGASADVYAVAGGQMNQAGLFGARDDANADTGLSANL